MIKTLQKPQQPGGPKSLFPMSPSVLAGTGLVVVAAGITFWTMKHKPFASGSATPKTGVTVEASPKQEVPVVATGSLPVVAQAAEKVATKTSSPRHLSASLPVLRTAYKRGEYRAVEQAVKDLQTEQATGAKSALPRAAVGQAEYLAAFAAARRGDLTVARQRFAQIIEQERLTPSEIKPATDSGSPNAHAKQIAVTTGEPQASLIERATFQHAVCTMGLKEDTAAEGEFLAFMKAYPESPLVAACIKRVAHLHGGDVPPSAEVVWQQATKTAAQRQKERERAASLCGPATLAEVLLRQQGTSHSAQTFRQKTDALAKVMKTDDHGTSMATLVAVAKQQGFPQAAGVALTTNGLQKILGEKKTVIALISDSESDGHYVLVEKIGPDGAVTLWDPNASGLLLPGERTVAPKLWGRMFSDGYAVVLDKQAH